MCDSLVDDDDPGLDTSSGSVWYADADCDDGEAAVNPGADEVCGDGIDNNCNGDTDAGLCGTLGVSDAVLTIYGETAGDRMGNAVEVIGDVNGDGLDDMFFGATAVDDAHSSDGRGYIVYGGTTGTVDVEDANATILAYEYGTTGGELGISAAGGDFDNDGYADLVIGSIHDDTAGTDAGVFYVIYGDQLASCSGCTTISDYAEATLYGANAGDTLGWSLAAIGDLDNDGMDDFAVGAARTSSWTGSVYQVYGAASLTGQFPITNAADATIEGGATTDEFGISLSSGDMNGDGTNDLLVGAQHESTNGSDAGAGYLFLGGLQ